MSDTETPTWLIVYNGIHYVEHDAPETLKPDEGQAIMIDAGPPTPERSLEQAAQKIAQEQALEVISAWETNENQDHVRARVRHKYAEHCTMNVYLDDSEYAPHGPCFDIFSTKNNPTDGDMIASGPLPTNDDWQTAAAQIADEHGFDVIAEWVPAPQLHCTVVGRRG